MKEAVYDINICVSVIMYALGFLQNVRQDGCFTTRNMYMIDTVERQRRIDTY